MLFIRGLFVAKLFAVAFTAGSMNQELTTKSIAGAHIRILAYHASFSSWKIMCKLIRNVWNWNNLQEPPIFYIIRNPANQTLVRFIGFPKDVFDVLSVSWNFTWASFSNLIMERSNVLTLAKWNESPGILSLKSRQAWWRAKDRSTRPWSINFC